LAKITILEVPLRSFRKGNNFEGQISLKTQLNIPTAFFIKELLFKIFLNILPAYWQ